MSALVSKGEQVSPAEREAMAQVAGAFIRKFGAPALSVAIARNGQMVYEQPFGVDSLETDESLQASNLFRIASVTKPITSVAIFSLVERGKLALKDKLFGREGILGTEYGMTPYRRYVTDITVDHLLTHTCGGWQNDSSDPMFRFPAMNHAQLITWTLDNLPLFNPPGEKYAYSNFGYCILGRVIERVARQPYADYVREQILAPCGVRDMRIAGNTLKQRAPKEVVYYGQSDEDPYRMNVTRMDSHGGWLATAADLAIFSSRVTGFGVTPGILKRETISKMVSPGPAERPSAEVKYARGWSVREDGRGNWWHNGSLPGTTSIMVRTASGFAWAALCNTRRQPADEFNLALDNLVWDMARKVGSWRL
jgi:CubicO group peptidase (beta-lactamase class C family)